MTLEETLVYGLILVKASSLYIIDRFGPNLAGSSKIMTTAVGTYEVLEPCWDWTVSLQEELSRAIPVARSRGQELLRPNQRK